ncbi:MAG: hypothetical protein HW405_387 [Candidatus Berkelbacteria bacterium]|nr:hypothetical protein [Candidatus Berkelbacteria bacterium]
MDNQIQKNPAPNGASENQIDFTGLNAPEPMGGKSTFQKPVSSQKSQTVTATMPTQAPVSQPQASTSVPPNTPPPPSPPAPNQTYDPLEDGHKSPVASYVLMAVLTLILILGVLVFISWKGWISLGGVEKLWGGGRVTSTPTVSPTESSTISPSISSSPVRLMIKSENQTL